MIGDRASFIAAASSFYTFGFFDVVVLSLELHICSTWRVMACPYYLVPNDQLDLFSSISLFFLAFIVLGAKPFSWDVCADTF